MPDVIAWCFHSPRRLLAVGVTAIVVLLAVAAAGQALLGGSSSGAGSPSPGVAAPADAAPAVAAAVEFTTRWASVPSGQTAGQWRAGLSDLVTPELAAGLELTDPVTLPGGGPDGQPVVRFLSVSSALIEVPLSSGRRILVTVVRVNARWLASDIQPLAGNLGDDPGPGSGGPSSAGARSPSGSSGG